MHKPMWNLVASSLLGVTAVAGGATAAFLFLGAWNAQRAFAGMSGTAEGTVAAALIGLLVVAFAASSAIAARDVWDERPRGDVLGVAVGVVTILATIATLAVGEQDRIRPLLFIAIGLGVATTAAVLLYATRDPATA